VSLNFIHSPIDPSIEWKILTPNTLKWERTDFDEYHYQLVSDTGFRLAPVSMVQPINILLRFRPSPTEVTFYTIVYGCAGSPIKHHSVWVTKQEKQAAVKHLIEAEGDTYRQQVFYSRFLGLGKMPYEPIFQESGTGRLGWDHGNAIIKFA
jgi:hypothetical protein